MTTLENVAFADTPDSSGNSGGGSRQSIPSPSQQQASSLYSMAPQNSNLVAEGMNSGNGGGVSNGNFDPSLEAQIFAPMQPYLSGAGYQQGMGELLAGMGAPMTGGPEAGGRGPGNGKGDEGFGDWWGQAGIGAGGWGL